MTETPIVVCFSAAGDAVAARVSAHLAAECWAHEKTATTGADRIRRVLSGAYQGDRPVVGVCAAGILIRLLKDCIGRKQVEPPVIAVSADGAHVVPLLGGHRGANPLARELAEFLGGTAAITTASESRLGIVLDDPPPGWVLAPSQDVKPFVARLLAGDRLRLEGHAPWLSESGLAAPDGSVPIIVSEHLPKDPAALHYHPKTLAAGVGCERGCAPEEVIALVEHTLAEARLAPASLAAIATIELKSDEPALIETAAHLGVPLRLFTAEELGAERHRLANPSAAVEAEIGIPGVAEAGALKAGELLVEKRKSRRATCAVGRSAEPIDVASFGRPVGRLFVVGLGPGGPAMRTPQATEALGQATDWVGYSRYLDLAADARDNQHMHAFPIGEERQRVRKALDLADAGKKVALVSSGDPGIYALASLVFEQIEASGARTAVTVVPGVSALQAASAGAGALIGHDFCAISLSDLLTPRETIVKRLEAAASGDFVTALYNPRSERRTELIAEARTVFLRHRPPETPVVVAANLGREGESVRVGTLVEFDPKSVDMNALVLFGATQSRRLTRPSGAVLAFTPRGYTPSPAGEDAP